MGSIPDRVGLNALGSAGPPAMGANYVNNMWGLTWIAGHWGRRYSLTEDAAPGLANRAYISPCYFPRNMWVSQIAWYNGLTVSGNIDAGLYTLDNIGQPDALVASTGSTAQSGADTRQAVNVTDFYVPRGWYFAALVASSTSADLHGISISGGYPMHGAGGGIYTDDSALPLPDPSVPSRSNADRIFIVEFDEA